MSESSDIISSKSAEEEAQIPCNILADHHGSKISEKFIHKITKESENVSKEVKNSCKVLHVSSESNNEETLAVLEGLDAKDYPNLFVIVVEGKNFGFLDENLEKSAKIKENLSKLGTGRPLVLQITSKDEKLSKCFYKEAGTDKFKDIHLWKKTNEKIEDFPTFLYSFLDVNSTSMDQLTAEWKQIIKSSLNIKFLKLFEFTYKKLILKVIKSGTKEDLLSALEAPVEHKGRILSIEAQTLLSELIPDSLTGRKSSDQANDEQMSSNNVSSNESDNNQALMDESATSVLFTAVEHKNIEVIDFLITYWTHLIQELPANHQMQISTTAFKSDQLDVLCDLLDIVDFPFPEDFEFDDELEHKRLRKITQERTAFMNAIKKENFEKIDKFIDDNRNLKCVYSIDNDTALTQAVQLKKFGVFYYLKSLGFHGKNSENILKYLDKEDCNKALKQAVKQRKTNVNQALVNVHKSVMLLATRSLIHNRRISKEQEAEYRQKIINWLQDIHKVAPEMLGVAASCEYLKIIFDFESDTVENASLAGPTAAGSTYSIKKWIFVGAELSDKKREQQIKGVLAHELCHYVMRLVYENQENPYYKDREDIKEMFERIVRAIDKWSAEDEAEHQDDECNGTISSVFTLYKPEDSHPELIVRVVQILTEFDDDEDRTRRLQPKYQNLFSFWHDQVIPELRKYLQKNQDVKKLNGFIDLLPKILKSKIKVKSYDNIKKAIGSKLTTVTTNAPTLLFVNICKVLQQEDKILMDSKNLFVEPASLVENLEIWKAFNQICRDVTELNIFVDCTKGVPSSLGNIFINKDLNFIFVVSNDDKCKELAKIFKQREIKDVTKMEINYNWSDLTEESQKMLLDIKINFQNNSEISLEELFMAKAHPGSETINPGKEVVLDLCQVIDDQLLNLIIDRKKLAINSANQFDTNENYFKLINIERQFIKKKMEKIIKKSQQDIDAHISNTVEVQSQSRRIESSNHHTKNATNNSQTPVNVVPVENAGNVKTEYRVKESTISENELFLEVKNQNFVLISDMAGNGKSWAMKNFTKILTTENLTSWVSYVDLKQFIKEFKAQEGQKVKPDFSSFMAEKILRTEHKFESKIFQKLYKDGKIFIIFDGFDEIAPNCAEFVSNLAKSFQSNGGNQLWIASRDYFEVDLRKKLEIDVAYGIENMNDENGVDLIVKSWILKDLENNKANMTKKEFNKKVQESPNLKKYKKKAEQIIEKVEMDSDRSVGMPQMFKMIADGFKDEHDIDNLTRSNIYEKFIINLYRRWSREKGEIREEASNESQKLEFSFWKFHLYHAILSKLPVLAKILFPGYNGKDWKVEEVIACGILSTKNGEYYFIHETIREYFAADALIKAFKNEKVDKKVLEVFVNVLTQKQYKIIRMFLDGMTDLTILSEIQKQMKNVFEKFLKTQNLEFIFAENLENFVDFVLSILKDCDYKKVKELMNRNSQRIIKETKNSKIFFKFQDFLCQFLTASDLKNVIKNQNIIEAIIKSYLGIEVFADFMLKIESKTGHEFVQNELRKAINEGWMQEDDFKFFFTFEDPKVFKFQKFLEMLQKFLSPTEIPEFLKKRGWPRENILLSCVTNESIKILETMWIEMENYFAMQNNSHNFKELLMQPDGYKKNILYKIAKIDDIEFHIIFWELLLNKFKNRDELKNFMLQRKYGFENNFVHEFVESNKNQEIIMWTFKMLKENFNDSQIQEFIRSKGKDNRNLIDSTALGGQNIQTFKFLWETFSSSLKSEQEFWKVLKEVDLLRCNILDNAAKGSPGEVFNFLTEEFEKNCSKEEIKKMLSKSDIWYRILLHYAAENAFTDTFKAVWMTFQKYFNHKETLDIAKQVDKDSENFLFCVKSSETFEFAIEELEKIATRDEIRSMLSSKTRRNRNILQHAAFWRKSIKLHECLWKILRKYFEYREIKNFIQNVDKDGKNLLHLAVAEYVEKEDVEHIWNETKTFLNRDEQFEYLKNKAENGKNLIELSKNYEIVQWLRNLLKEYEIQL